MSTSNKQKVYQAAAALLVAVLFCLPMYSGMIRSGPDTAFHLARILQLSEALKHGDLYPRIFPELHMHFGYGSPLFYSVCMLYPAALLVCLGVGLLMAWRVSIFLIVFCAAYLIQSLVQPMAKHRLTPVLSSALCLLNPYVYANCYKRGALGEMLALVFLPVVLMGIRDVLFRKRKNIRYFTIGFTGLILSHNISFILALVLLVVFFVLNIRKVNKDVLYSTALSLFLAFLLTAFFTLPMIEQLQTHLYRISGYFGETSLADSACSIKEFFLPGLGDQVMMCVCPGLCALLAAGALLTGNRMQKQCFALGVCLMIGATRLFPWNTLTMFSFMQFPARLLTPAVVLLGFASVPVLDLVFLKGRKQIRYGLAALMFVLVSIHIIQLYSNWGAFNDSLETEKIFNEKRIFGSRAWYNRMELSTPDYLPASAQIDYYMYDSGTVKSVSGTVVPERSYGKLLFTVEENGDWVVPKTYYKGYRAVTVDENGRKTGSLPVEPDEYTGMVRVTVQDAPVRIKVYYGNTAVQIISDLLSLGGAVLCGLLVYERRLRSRISAMTSASRTKR